MLKAISHRPRGSVKCRLAPAVQRLALRGAKRGGKTDPVNSVGRATDRRPTSTRRELRAETAQSLCQHTDGAEAHATAADERYGSRACVAADLARSWPSLPRGSRPDSTKPEARRHSVYASGGWPSTWMDASGMDAPSMAPVRKATPRGGTRNWNVIVPGMPTRTARWPRQAGLSSGSGSTKIRVAQPRTFMTLFAHA